MTDISATITTAPASPDSARRSPLTGMGAALLALLVIAADLLFWGHEPQLSILIFALLLTAAIVAMNHSRAFDLRGLLLIAVTLIGLAPMVEDVSPLSVLMGMGALTLLALGLSRQLPAFEEWAGTFTRFAIPAPLRLVDDAVHLIADAGRLRLGSRALRAAVAWLVPIACAIVFVLLFAAANPLVETALRTIRLDELANLLDAGRLLLWGFIAAFAWALLAPRLLRWQSAAPMQGPVRPRAESLLFGRTAILNSLVLFNALFAVQTAMDLLYLWGGLRLPDELTYAEYAHRGAHPLVVTALLAAAFVLAAMRRGGPGEASPLIRNLVYLWIAQNVWLVISSLLRLRLYVETYQLTEMRIAAGVWMVLVAIGLVLIVARIALGRSNRWLVASNLVVLSVTLWGVCWIDFPAVISRYNVQHSYEVTGQGAPIDLYYLGQLGAGSVPAFDEFLATARHASAERIEAVRIVRNGLAWRQLYRSPDGEVTVLPIAWRGWSLREARLRDYLETRMFAPRAGSGTS